MQFPRVFTVLSFLFAFTLCFVSATPIESDKSLAKRQEAEIITILTKLQVEGVATALEISAFAVSTLDLPLIQSAETLALTGLATEEQVTDLFTTLTGQIDAATAALGELEPTQKRQSSDDVATLVATIITSSQDITTALDGVLDQLSAIPTIGTLFTGLDAALNQLLKGLEGLLAGVLNLVATLLVNVAALLRRLALGLTLGSLGL